VRPPISPTGSRTGEDSPGQVDSLGMNKPKAGVPQILTTESGAPVADNQNSQTAGPLGPVLLQDQHLLEKLARFNRERIPERVVHAVGSAAYGNFEVTRDASEWTSANFLGEVGRTTRVLTRFSTVAGSRGAPDTARDPRGFAMKFYTEEGNYDLVGNNTPIFFIRDPLKFPDFIHSQKYDPYTNAQEADNVWDFFSHAPEATHQFTWLFGDRGIPASYRKMDGFGSHTFQWRNAAGNVFWVKYHFKTDQGIECLTSEQAAAVGGADPEHHQKDLLNAIDSGDFPSWTLSVQIMPEDEALDYRFNPFDLTKTWSQKDYPLIEIGRMTLDENPPNYFAHVEQSAFDPGNFVPGIGPSPDKMLQGRLFAYGDAHRYRLGVNHSQLPVNAPSATVARNYGRDGLMAFGDNGGSSVNYEPNSHEGPAQTNASLYAGTPVAGDTGAYAPVVHSEDTDFVQAGDLWRLQDSAAQSRLACNIAGSLAGVTREDVVEQALSYFTAADPDFGSAIRAALADCGYPQG
jgi:catalase